MKDFLPAILLVICGLAGLSLVLNKENNAEYEFLQNRESSGSIYIHAEQDFNGSTASRTHILSKDDIIISGDSIYRSKP